MTNDMNISTNEHTYGKYCIQVEKIIINIIKRNANLTQSSALPV